MSYRKLIFLMVAVTFSFARDPLICAPSQEAPHQEAPTGIVVAKWSDFPQWLEKELPGITVESEESRIGLWASPYDPGTLNFKLNFEGLELQFQLCVYNTQYSETGKKSDDNNAIDTIDYRTTKYRNMAWHFRNIFMYLILQDDNPSPSHIKTRIGVAEAINKFLAMHIVSIDKVHIPKLIIKSTVPEKWKINKELPVRLVSNNHGLKIGYYVWISNRQNWIMSGSIDKNRFIFSESSNIKLSFSSPGIHRVVFQSFDIESRLPNDIWLSSPTYFIDSRLHPNNSPIEVQSQLLSIGDLGLTFENDRIKIKQEVIKSRSKVISLVRLHNGDALLIETQGPMSSNAPSDLVCKITRAFLLENLKHQEFPLKNFNFHFLRNPANFVGAILVKGHDFEISYENKPNSYKEYSISSNKVMREFYSTHQANGYPNDRDIKELRQFGIEIELLKPSNATSK